jgi:hypothetical protein
MNRHIALEWWGSLSINEQKEYSRKHLLSYQYLFIWDWSYSKNVSRELYLKLRIEVWEGEGSPMFFKKDLVEL